MEQTKQKEHLEYPDLTMYEMVAKAAGQFPSEPAYEFYNKKTSYRKLLERIDRTARAFVQAGIQKGDAVTICMPNTPQAIDCFYALDRIGAVANMVHPLSAPEEITMYLNISESKMLLTVDLFYEKAAAARDAATFPAKILVARMQEELPPHLAIVYLLKKGKDYLKFPNLREDILWKDFLKFGDGPVQLPEIFFEKKRTSVILYSGGTSGTPKGICLTDYNINACALQAREAMQTEFQKGLKMLSCMPMFHGFGLTINIHIVLIHGACCILMPTFTNKSYAAMLKKKKPNFIAGVPTIFEALLHLKELDGVDLSFLLGMFCGGDSLSIELKRQIDAFLKEHNASIQVREGYGLTECVTASCLTPKLEYREGSIGIPFPDTFYAIVKPGTHELLPPGEQGEIILSGPSVMTKYLKNEKETKETLQVLPDGRTWLYTGDIGKMDEDGFVFFRGRAKRMIVTSGYNVYPAQIENILDAHEKVHMSCVVGVPDDYRMHAVKAFIMLKPGYQPSQEIRDELLAYCRKNIAKYAVPREIEFRDDLPKTLVGKVAYRVLEEEEEAKYQAKKDATSLVTDQNTEKK